MDGLEGAEGCTSLPSMAPHPQVLLLACLSALVLRSSCADGSWVFSQTQESLFMARTCVPVGTSPLSGAPTLPYPVPRLILLATLCPFLNHQAHRLNPDSFDSALGGPSHLSSHLGMGFGRLGSHLFCSHLDGQEHHLTDPDTQHHPSLALPVSLRLPSVLRVPMRAFGEEGAFASDFCRMSMQTRERLHLHRTQALPHTA